MLKKRFISYCLLGIAFILTSCNENQSYAQETIVYDYSILLNNKEKMNENPEINMLVDKLLIEADEALSLNNLSVVSKDKLPPSNDKHDYLSQATYWWPNPKTKDGLPYIPKDGQSNPERLKIKDLSYLVDLSRGVRVLGLAFFYTGDPKYANKVEELLNVWFIEPKTKMNPNLNYTQFIPGVSEGRAEGLIDSRYFIEVIDGMMLVKDNISTNTYNGVKKWFDEFVSWMDTSKIGSKGKGLKNNIGTAYYMQKLVYLRLNDKDEIAKEILKKDIPRLINEQFDNEGSQLYESRRTKSWNYSIANLKYWFNIAKIGEDLGLDIWNIRMDNEKSLRQGYAYLRKFADGERSWPGKQISKIDYDKSFKSLRIQGQKKYNSQNSQGNMSKSRVETSLNDVNPIVYLTEYRF